jgi:protein O-GlcNAc transferase
VTPLSLQLQSLFSKKKYLEIIEIIEKQTKENDRSAGLLNVYGVCKVLTYTNDLDDLILALHNFKKAIQKENKTTIGLEALINYINVLVEIFDKEEDSPKSNIKFKDLEEAIFLFEQAKSHFGYNYRLYLSIVRVYKRLSQINKSINYLEQIKMKNDLDIGSFSSYIYYNSFLNNWSQNSFFLETSLINSLCEKINSEKFFNIEKKNSKKIKIGFVSSDIQKKHSITFFLKTILLQYDKNEFEINLYLNNKIDDETTDDFKDLVDGYYRIFNLSDLEATNLIRQDKLDIVFDLMGITSSHRISLFKNRLAPIQISWLGYCNTSGLLEMDFLIADKNLIYPDEERLYSEKIIYLENIWNCHEGFNYERKYIESPMIKNGYITFGSFNNFNKINDTVVKTWSNILKHLKNSKLILKSSTKIDLTYLKEKFNLFGVLESVVFLGKERFHANHLEAYNNIDISLDTFPYNGVTTSFESIWKGVPVLTIKGFNFNSRCGESINKNINLIKFIAKDIEDYTFKAIDLGSSANELIKIRKKIFYEALLSPLFNKKEFSNNFYNSIKKLKKNISG